MMVQIGNQAFAATRDGRCTNNHAHSASKTALFQRLHAALEGLAGIAPRPLTVLTRAVHGLGQRRRDHDRAWLLGMNRKV